MDSSTPKELQNTRVRVYVDGDLGAHTVDFLASAADSNAELERRASQIVLTDMVNWSWARVGNV